MKKVSSKRTAAKAPPIETELDAIGLARPLEFQDFPAAVSVMSHAKTRRIMDRFDWNSSPRVFMAIWEAEEHIEKFKREHKEAILEEHYKTDDKTILELTASYNDGRASHRVVYQARNK